MHHCLAKLADCYINEDKVDKAIKILEMREALLTKQLGKDVDRYGNMLNDLALKCEKEHKYNQAKQLELATIKIAQTKKCILKAGLPAFYCFLYINCTNQNKRTESEKYLQEAIEESNKVTKSPIKQYADKYLASLPGVVWQNVTDKKLSIAEEEFRKILKIYKIICPASDVQYDLFYKFGDVLYAEEAQTNTAGRLPEVVEYSKKCTKIAKNSKSSYKGMLSDLFGRVGGCQLSLHQFNEANKNYAKALELDPDKSGFHSTSLIFWWGAQLVDTGEHRLGVQKLDIAYRLTRKLSPEKRGTLLADLLKMLGILARNSGNTKQGQNLFAQSDAEIKLQKSLIKHTDGPDYLNRMRKS